MWEVSGVLRLPVLILNLILIAALPRAESACLCLCPDGSDSRDKPKLYRLQHSITEVGSDCTEDGAIQVN